MGDCMHCGETNVLTKSCNYCGKDVCTDHILPENHDCPQLDNLNQTTRRFESAFTDSTPTAERTPATLDPETRDGNTDDSPDPLDDVQTYGGSGRDLDREDLPSSPDVNPDGTLDDSDVDDVPDARRMVDDRSQWELRLDQVRENKWTYLTIIVALIVLQFGFGIDVVGVIQQYFPG